MELAADETKQLWPHTIGLQQEGSEVEPLRKGPLSLCEPSQPKGRSPPGQRDQAVIPRQS